MWCFEGAIKSLGLGNSIHLDEISVDITAHTLGFKTKPFKFYSNGTDKDIYVEITSLEHGLARLKAFKVVDTERKLAKNFGFFEYNDETIGLTVHVDDETLGRIQRFGEISLLSPKNFVVSVNSGQGYLADNTESSMPCQCHVTELYAGKIHVVNEFEFAIREAS